MHLYDPKYYNYANLDENYCRNPLNGETSETIWCYTTDLIKTWDYCDPIHEEQKAESGGKSGQSLETLTGKNLDRGYRGSQHMTRSGRVCQKWST
jgi:hypothetical protein